MLRRNLYLADDQIEFLENQKDISLSEHVRRALDEYIDKIKSKKVSASQSRREGE